MDEGEEDDEIHDQGHDTEEDSFYNFFWKHMIIYVEKKYKENKITQNILSKYKKREVLYIENYKNIFDKNISVIPEKSIIIAGINSAISEAPKWYWHEWWWYFFKNSLNCVYDCTYCYLKWSFKNDMTVIFVNYDDIKKQILDTIKKFRKKDKESTLWFYASDYSDNLAIDDLTLFTHEFIPFFETLENVKMEIRTKSINIKNILLFNGIKNTEIAFSLNPSEVIKQYEFSTPSLDLRMSAIKKLIDNNIQVWIRFMPLLEMKNYKEIYRDFLEFIIKQLDFTQIYSIFIWWLLYTKSDYNTMLRKEPYLDLLYKLEDSQDGFYREKKEVRDYFYNLFDSLLSENQCNICLDKKDSYM